MVRSVPEPPKARATLQGARVLYNPVPHQRNEDRIDAMLPVPVASFVLPVVERGLLSEKPVGGVGVCVRVCARACVCSSRPFAREQWLRAKVQMSAVGCVLAARARSPAFLDVCCCGPRRALWALGGAVL